MSSGATQRAHYDAIIAEYELHYDDPLSQAYRQRFVYSFMFAGIDLTGKKVLEAMCGTGQTTRYILERGATVWGLDISMEAIARFKRHWPMCGAIQASILDLGLKSGIFDCVVVVGGLHHLHPHLQRGIDEIHRVLRPGGYFCFAEPNRGSLLDTIRKVWYKLDPLFAPGEAAIDMDKIKRENASRFEFALEKYGGNLAYLFVLNSMIFRIPAPWKPFYAPLMMRMEAALTPLSSNRCFSHYVICRWRKR